MLGIVSEDENHNKIFKPMAGATLGQGVPLGTWASFEKDYAPNPEWLEAGTDFDANAFPALAMYLGGTKVPERYDHNRLGEFENITLPTTSATALSMPYDGELIVRYLNYDEIMVYVNNEQISGGRGYHGSSQGSSTIPFKKGDEIYVTYSRLYFNPKVAYYKHPMFIKATPTSSNSDYQGTLQAVMQYIRNMNSYSTEEKWTGGYWIDGKKIYRKTYYSATNWGNGATVDTVSDVDMVITLRQIASDGNSYREFYTDYTNGIGLAFMIPTGQIKTYRSGSLVTSKPSLIVFEYTKTND